MREDFMVIYQVFPYLIKGCAVTLGLVGGALSLGFIMGIPIAIGQVYSNKYVAGLFSVYVWFFRGIPVLVLFFLFYFGVFSFIGLNLSPFIAALVVLGLIKIGRASCRERV